MRIREIQFSSFARILLAAIVTLFVASFEVRADVEHERENRRGIMARDFNGPGVLEVAPKIAQGYYDYEEMFGLVHCVLRVERYIYIDKDGNAVVITVMRVGQNTGWRDARAMDFYRRSRDGLKRAGETPAENPQTQPVIEEMGHARTEVRHTAWPLLD